jgi:Ca-activated chloride channel family protein
MRPEANDAARPESTVPVRARSVLLAALLALTLAAGVAARIVTEPAKPRPGDDPVDLTTSSRSGDVQLAATLDRGSVLAGSDGTLRVELVIGADEAPFGGGQGDATRIPTDLVVILDRSGSMRGQPLEFAKAAVHELLDQLGPADRFGLVTYATGAEVAIALSPASSAAKQTFGHAVRGLHANGGTNMARGMDLAHDMLTGTRRVGRSPRVILISDGHANQGDHSVEGLRRRAGRAVSAEYVLSSAGVGQGFDETVMSSISDAGTGNFYYLPDARELAGVFADEFASARERVARALEVLLQPGDGIQVVDAAGLPLAKHQDGVRFHPGDLFAGQERRIFVTLRAPTHAVGELHPGRVSLAFTDAEGVRRQLSVDSLPRISCVAAEQEYFASFDDAVYRRAGSAEGIGALKQQVAEQLKAGRVYEARSAISGFYQSMQEEQLNALGYVVADDLDEVERLRSEVAKPSAAEPEVQRRLGKELLEAGRDARRVGSKRK